MSSDKEFENDFVRPATNESKCWLCGESVPEGTQVCPECMIKNGVPEEQVYYR